MYDRYVDLADRLFDKYGSATAYLNTPGSQGTYNPDTGKYEDATDAQDTAIKAIFTPVEEDRVDGQNVLVSDVIIKIAAKDLTVTPAVGMFVKRGDDVYTILSKPKVVKPGDTVIMYECHGRVG